MQMLKIPLDEVAVSTFREVMSQCIRIEDNEVGSLLNIKTTGTIQNIEMSEAPVILNRR